MYSNPVKDWFYFSRRQRAGIIVMLILLAVVPVLAGLLGRTVRHQTIDHDWFVKEISLFREALARMEEEAESRGRERSPEGGAAYAHRLAAPELTPFPFDPNVIDQEDWERMGLSARLARSIGNFLSAGGSFRYKEDLQRMYLMDDLTYEQLAGYILLPERPVSSSSGERPTRRDSSGPGSDSGLIADVAAHKSPERDISGIRPPAEPLIININTADSLELIRIRGIGPAFSRRIIQYRERLGGYHDVSQLLEVFGMDTTRFEQIREYLVTDSMHIRRINLNEAEFGDLVRHPYIDRNTASAILNMRRQHGPFATPEEIKRSYLLNDSIWERIRLYIAVE